MGPVLFGSKKPKSWSGSHLTIKMVTGPNRSGLRMILPSSHYTRALRKPEKRCQNHCLLSWSTRSRVWAQSFSPFLCVLAVTVSIMYMLWPMWECIFHFRNKGLVPILKKLFLPQKSEISTSVKFVDQFIKWRRRPRREKDCEDKICNFDRMPTDRQRILLSAEHPQQSWIGEIKVQLLSILAITVTKRPSTRA